jgi:hypothetical protein
VGFVFFIPNAVDELSKNLIGTQITRINVNQTSLIINFDNGSDLTISKDCNTRPILEGNKQHRAFDAEDDLRKAVFLSPTTEIWV